MAEAKKVDVNDPRRKFKSTRPKDLIRKQEPKNLTPKQKEAFARMEKARIARAQREADAASKAKARLAKAKANGRTRVCSVLMYTETPALKN
jgi:hypothetical protein